MTKKIITRAKIVLLCLALVCLAISLGSFFKEVPTVMAQNSAVTYSADFSNGLPYDWVEYNRSDVTEMESPKKSGDNLVLTHDITRSDTNMESLYYGGVYKIAQSVGDVSDFTLTLTYRVLASRDNLRWVGVMYHTQETIDGKLSGYLMNYRVNGKSAASVIKNTPDFNDFNVVESTGIAHDKTTFITLKITVDGDTATHYVNNQVITTYNLSSKEGVLGGTQKDGGFALIVNISKIEIKNLTIEGVRSNEKTSYVANFANGLPTDWNKNQKSNSAETTIDKVTDGIKLTHTGSQDANTYFGGFLDIATGLTNATNFVLEARLSMTSYENTSRWVGIAYHKQQNASGYSSFYMMNYRQNGATAFSTITPQPKFNDEHSSETTLTQGNNVYHTMRIVVKNLTAYHYVDTTLVQIVDLQSKEGVMGNTHVAGGFGLLFNKCSITISHLWIKADVLGENLPTTTTVAHPTLEYSPTIVTSAKTVEDITGATKKGYADSMIFEIDANLNVVNNNAVLTTLDKALQQTNSVVLPIVRINSNNVATAFLNYITENNVTDIAVISTDANLLKAIRTTGQGKYVRAILDWTQNATPLISSTDWQNVVNTTNACRANVALLKNTDATKNAVTYIQARLMTVWVNQPTYSSFSTHEIITTGAYGILSDSPNKVYDDFTLYADALPLIRTPYNIAHRGIPNDYAENSLYGYQRAYETGATHIEVDVHLTKDGQLVVMHDTTIDRTTTGTGAVKDMTLAEIKKYKIDRLYNGTYLNSTAYQPIPSLAEVFDYFDDKDIVYALEIKSKEDNVVQKLKELIDAYNVKHQIFVIAFGVNVIEQMRDVLPEVPSALLGTNTANWSNTTSFTANNRMLNEERYTQIAQLATNLDLTNGNAYVTEALKHRGYMSFYWTYQQQADIETAFKNGCLGITNNKSQSIEPYARSLQAKSQDYNLYDIQTLIDNKFAMQYVTYGDDVIPCEATLHTYESHDYYYNVIFKYTFTSNTGALTYTLYSESVKIINPAYYMSVQDINAILNTPAENLTLDDIPNIENAKIAYTLLTDEDKALVENIDGADDLINRIVLLNSYFEVSIDFDSAKGTVVGAADGDEFIYNSNVVLTVDIIEGFVISSITVNDEPIDLTSNKNATVEFVVTQDCAVVVEFDVDKDFITEDDEQNPPNDGTGDGTNTPGDGTGDGQNTPNGGNNTNNGENNSNSQSAITCVMATNADCSIVFTFVILLLTAVVMLGKKRLNKKQ